jgi:hypothetical protein
MPRRKSRFGKATSAGDDAEVRIVVRPDKIAQLYPPAEDVEPLLPYRKFAIEGKPGDAALDEPGLPPSMAFPAGLVPYIEAALAADGYAVTIDDRRRAAPSLAADKQFYRDSTGPERAFLRAVRKNPLGQIIWTDWADIPWRLWSLTALYPRARFLVAEATRAGRSDLYRELRDYVSRRRDDEQTARAVRYLRALARSRSGRRGTAILEGYADVHAARQIDEADSPAKLIIQARLLARQTPPEIALLTGVPVQVVNAFEALFFQCRDRFSARDWIRLHCIGPLASALTGVPDAAAVLKMFAYYCGAVVLDAVLPFLAGGKDLFDAPLDLTTPEGRQEQAVRLAIALHLLPRVAAADARLHQIMLLLLERERKQPVRHAEAPLLAAQTESRVTEALAGAPPELTGDVERPAIDTVEAQRNRGEAGGPAGRSAPGGLC